MTYTEIHENIEGYNRLRLRSNVANAIALFITLLIVLFVYADLHGPGDMIGMSIIYIPFVAPFGLVPALVGIYYRVKMVKQFIALRTIGQYFLIFLSCILIGGICFPLISVGLYILHK